MVKQIELLTPTIRQQFGTSVSKSNRMRKRMGEIGSSGSNCNNVMCSPQMGVPQPPPPPPPMPSRKRICRARKHYPPKQMQEQQHKEDPWWMRIQIGDNIDDNNKDKDNDKDNNSCIFDDRRNERNASMNSMNSIGLHDALDGELLESKPHSLECEVDITKTCCDLNNSTRTNRTADTSIMQPWDFL